MKSRGGGRQRLTLKSIAERLDVSTATVSLALRDSPLVAVETRERIKETAREAGYVYNRSAASLRTQRSNIIGVAFYDIVNPYFAEMLVHIEEQLNQQKHTILLCNHAESLERQIDFIETLQQYGADGVILCPAVGTTARDIEAIQDAGLPLVLICRSVAGIHVDRVVSDDELGMRRATAHLISQGHRRIAMIGGYPTASTFAGRTAGYRSVLEKHGIPFDPDLYCTGAPVRRFGREIIETLLDLDHPPTAAVCVNDMTAVGVMTGLQKRGLTAGRDFGLVGYDDVDESAHLTPSLTSVSNNQEGIGATASRLLLERIADPDRAPEEVVLEPVLKIRESSRSG
jgi:LacI family transcriptional regulator